MTTYSKIKIDNKITGWNEYINAERSNMYSAAKIKKKEKDLMMYYCINQPKITTYPIEIQFIWHFKDKRRDLDNQRVKGILDGLVAHGIIKNDNLNCIRRIVHDSIIDGTEVLEILFNEYKDN